MPDILAKLRRGKAGPEGAQAPDEKDPSAAADGGKDAAAETAAGADAASAKRPFIQRVPTPFFVVGYGCTTCIGNSGPLDAEISESIQDNVLAVTAVLSGNRNFEGRISPDVKMNYLASPPLVIAYALAGTMDFDFESEPLGQDAEGKDVFLKDIWPAADEVDRLWQVVEPVRVCEAGDDAA